MSFLTSFFKLIFFMLFYFIVLLNPLMADSIVLKDGSVLKGIIIRQEKNLLLVDTKFAGKINIKWDQVIQFQADKDVKIMLITGEIISTRYVKITNKGLIRLKKQAEDEVTNYKQWNVSFINPEPWRLGEGYKISGNANMSLKSQHGNTQKNELELDGNIEFRSLTDRYIFTGNLENDDNNGIRTANNWMLYNKYDYFVSKQRYYGAGLFFQSDKFTDLHLRSALEAHIGHQFYESKAVNLKTEIGFGKVIEKYIDSKNKDYFSLMWDINYDQFFFSDITQFYHRQKAYWDIEKSGKLNLFSWTGFKFPLYSGIVASAEVELEYDSQPNNKISKADRTYRLKLGYQW